MERLQKITFLARQTCRSHKGFGGGLLRWVWGLKNNGCFMDSMVSKKD